MAVSRHLVESVTWTKDLRADYTPSQSAGTVLLAGLRAVPNSLQTQLFDSHAPFFASLMFAQLLRNTESCKRLAREVTFSSGPPPAADGDKQPASPEDDEEAASLVDILLGNLMLAQREQAQCANNVHANPAMESLTVEWSRVMVGYLIVLSVWCWESPKTVRDFLSEGANMQVVSDCLTLSTAC